MDILKNKLKVIFEKARNKKGMTLVEMLIVVSIIAFLVLLVLVYLRTQVFKGTDSRRKTDLRKIAIAVEEYEKDNNCYPLPSQVTCSPGNGLLPYLDKIPCDPETNASYYYEHEDSSCPRWFRIYSTLDNESDPDYMSGVGPMDAYQYFVASSNDIATGPVSGGVPAPEGVNYYGCFSGVCTQISWNPNRPGPMCDPNFQNSTCYGQCSNPSNECQIW